VAARSSPPPSMEPAGLKSSGTPEVTVVIPTLNRWPLLSRHGLPSARHQEGVDFEVVVVDDGSTDETPRELARLGDPRVRVTRHESRRGLAAARNTGIAAARGEWLAFLDDDDLWSPLKLRTQLDAAASAGASWAYAAAVAVDPSGAVVEADPLPDPGEVASLLLSGGNFVPGGGSDVIARTELVRRVGGFDEELRFFEDWDLWLRLAAEDRPAACEDVLVARLEHAQNMLFRDRPNVMRDFERLLDKHREVTRDDRLGLAQWVAAEHHRAGRRLAAARLYATAALAYKSPGNVPPAIGALFGERGMSTVRGLLSLLGRPSHIEAKPSLGVEPAWLELYR
jgi:glycosyltransferase involved in cell wall biosynthesis